MLYHFFEYIENTYNLAGAGLFQFLSFRAGLAVILSLTISMVFGKRIIRSLTRLQVGETVRDLGLDGQKEKEGTPTMGGIIIVMAILIPCLLLADLTNVYIQLMLVVCVALTLVGFMDDYIKVFRKNKKGLHGRFKVLGQVVVGMIVAMTMLHSHKVLVRADQSMAEARDWEIVEYLSSVTVEPQVLAKTSVTNVPFFKGNKLEYRSIVSWLGDGWEDLALSVLFTIVVIFIITAVSNAANITDGIDGLAAGTSGIIALVLLIFAYVSGRADLAAYLDILYIPYTGELVIFAACFLGGCIGFLWYNTYPAQVFMGDTGSLMLGGVIAAMAIVLRKELLLPLICGVFFIEIVSVILQVSYFKYTKKKHGEGKRIFLMSPLHHHYQKLKMHESKIVSRFWIVQILLAIMAVITLKIR